VIEDRFAGFQEGSKPHFRDCITTITGKNHSLKPVNYVIARGDYHYPLRAAKLLALKEESYAEAE